MAKENMSTGSSPVAWTSRATFSWIVAAIVLCNTGCGPSEKQLREQEERKAKEAEAAKIESLKAKVLDLLSDPASAQFRRVKLLDGEKGLCGELNAKNKLGGYTGFTAFAVDSKGRAMVLRTTTLDNAKQSDAKIVELAVSATRAGNKSDAESLVYDRAQSKQFAFWSECGN